MESDDLNKMVEEEMKSDLPVPQPLDTLELRKQRVINCNNIKYTETELVPFINRVYNWFVANEDAVFIKEFWQAPDNQDLDVIPYPSLMTAKARNPRTEVIWAEVKGLLEVRLFKAGWDGKKNAGLTKFALQNLHGWKDASEQDITIQTKTTEYKFQNPELTVSEEKEPDDE